MGGVDLVWIQRSERDPHSGDYYLQSMQADIKLSRLELAAYDGACSTIREVYHGS